MRYYHTCNVCITTVLLFEQWRYEPVFSHCRNTENIFTVWPELLPAWLRTLASISCSIAFQVFNRKFRATVQIGQDSFFNVGQFVCHRFGLRFRLTIRDRRKHPKSVRDFVFHKLRHTVTGKTTISIIGLNCTRRGTVKGRIRYTTQDKWYTF